MVEAMALPQILDTESLTLQQRIALHDNDYSFLEPFSAAEPLTSSVIIPVYNERELLRNTLQNLASQVEVERNPSLFEVIIVNDGSQEDIDAIVEGISFPCHFVYLSLPKNRGRSHARNSGIEIAQGELLFFLDSDVLLPRKYFQQHWNVHAAAQRPDVSAIVVGFAENIFISDEKIIPLAKGEQIIPDIKRDFRYQSRGLRWQATPRTYRLMDETDNFKRFIVDYWTLPDMVVSHNLSVRRQDALAIGGFCEAFQGWGYEDTYFGAQLIGKLGTYVIPCTQTGVFRVKHAPRSGDEEKKQQECARNKVVYWQLLAEVCV